MSLPGARLVDPRESRKTRRTGTEWAKGSEQEEEDQEEDQEEEEEAQTGTRESVSQGRRKQPWALLPPLRSHSC